MKKQTILVVVFVAIGLLAMGSLALAQDTFTINTTENQGLQGSRFVPSVFFGTAGAGGGTPCEANSAETGAFQPNGFFAGNCTNHANTVLDAWFTGGYFEPRGGTGIIPPSGDHHRSGWRAMMVPAFSGGSWLTGFAPFLNEFPNFPQVGTPGPGMDPDLLLLFLDHHGEPLTPGRFPRYIPHERQAWADTLMVKYVASQAGGGLGFTQSIRSQVGQSRIGRDWRSMSDESANGCDGGWCDWIFSVGGDGMAGTTDDVLTRTQTGPVGADGTAGNADDGTQYTVTVTSSLRIDSFRAAGAGRDGTEGNADDGQVDTFKAMAPIEKVPTVIDDRLMQSDNDLAGCSFDNTGPDATGFVPIVTLPSVGSCASSTDGTDSLGTRDEADQSLRYQIQVVSGPNFHAEEGSDPYTWQICGSRSPGYGENDCDAGTTDIIGESERFAFRGAGVYDQSERFGADGRFFTADDGAGADAVKGNSDDTLVVCTGVGADNGYTDTTGTTYRTENCDSDPGADDVYGTADDGVIFFQEAIEDGFRSGTRENRPFAFSFIDAQASLRQVMTQSVEGFLASCLNCNSTAGEHAPFAAPGPLNYDWTFPGTLATQPDDHPPAASGSVPVFLP